MDNIVHIIHGISNWFCPSVRHRKVFITGNSESTMTSKREDNDEIRHILADVYLIEHKYFSDYQYHPPHSLLGRDIRIQIRHGNARHDHSEDSFTKTESEGSTILAIATANLCMSVPLGTGQRAHAYIMRLLFNEYRACLELLEAAVYYVTLYPTAGMLHSR